MVVYERGLDGCEPVRCGTDELEVNSFKYLGRELSRDGGMNVEIDQRVSKENTLAGALRLLWQNRSMSRQTKVKIYESIVVPSMIYGSETWNMSAGDQARLEVVEMKYLRSICGLTR